MNQIEKYKRTCSLYVYVYYSMNPIDNDYCLPLHIHIDTHVLICRIPHLENFSGNDKNVLLAQINKCKQIFVLYVHKNA